MEVKTFEIRDSATFVPVMATRLLPRNERDIFLLRRAGFGFEHLCVMMTLLGDGRGSYDPYSWGGRTYPVAHNYILEHWDELENGAVIDVEFILGEKPTAKVSEQFS